MEHCCINHPQKKAISFCHICKNYYCEECLIEGNEYYYCHMEECLNELQKERRSFKESYETNPRFCPNCLNDTSSESMGNMSTTNFIGQSFIQVFGGVCPVCNSFIAEKQYIIFGIPVKSYGYYRVIQIRKFRTDLAGSREIIFNSRKLLNQGSIEI